MIKIIEIKIKKVIVIEVIYGGGYVRNCGNGDNYRGNAGNREVFENGRRGGVQNRNPHPLLV